MSLNEQYRFLTGGEMKIIKNPLRSFLYNAQFNGNQVSQDYPESQKWEPADGVCDHKVSEVYMMTLTAKFHRNPPCNI